ncbi:MAG TPA: type 1 glutamine amidotransferase domain-containing protein [Caulobacteraceae bacterium]|nr:type 1 glutamine amidotransferase domain-containing protein [Caulobacteraceae bacterium]
MARILAVVASTMALPSGQPTGFWLEELAAPYLRFVAAGHEVDIASPAGGSVSHDPASELEAFLTDDGRAFLDRDEAKAKLAASLRISAVDADNYAAVFLVGGVPAASDFDANPALNALLGKLVDRGKVVSGVCHGVVGLTSLKMADGGLAATNEPMTGFSHDEEVALNLLDVVSVVPQARLRAIGADYRKAAEPFGVCVVEGSLFITGQNPASAGPAAEAVIARLRSV